MSYKSALYLLLFILPLGCKDALPEAKEFPVIITCSPNDVDKTGATFQGELIIEGDVSTTSYGFVWGINDPTLENDKSIILDKSLSSNNFSFRIDRDLIADMAYKVRAFAKYGSKIVYGNLITFTSKGSRKNGWSRIESNLTYTGEPTYGCSNSDFGYVLFGISGMYQFDPATNKFSTVQSYPKKGNIYTRFTMVNAGKIIYTFSNISANLYAFDNGVWEIKSPIPSEYWRYSISHLGFSANNKGYILNSSESYMFDLNSNIWQKITDIPEEYGSLKGGTSIDGIAYLLTSKKHIVKYEASTDSWSILTTYPGIPYPDIISFTYNRKIYFGLTSGEVDDISKINKSLWSFDLESKKWEKMEDFPSDYSKGYMFYFYLKDNLYVGYSDYKDFSQYKIWKYDPSKNDGL